jgi:hypothetical protein
MRIKDILSKEKYGIVKIASDSNVKILQEMLNQMANPKELNPTAFYHEWLKGNDSVMNKLSVSLLRDYPLDLKCGYRPKQFYVTSLLGNDIRDYIHAIFNVAIDFRKNKLLSYNYQTYVMVTEYIIVLTFSKFRIESLYREHIIYICIRTMFTFFTIYRENEFLVSLDHVFGLTRRILDSDVSFYEKRAKELGIHPEEKPESQLELNPTIDDIMLFVTSEDSQTEIKNKIMKWYLCKDRKARQIMTQFGLTNPKYTRKDFKKEE